MQNKNSKRLYDISSNILDESRYLNGVVGYKNLLDYYQISANIKLPISSDIPMPLLNCNTTDYIKIDELIGLSASCVSKQSTTMMQYYDNNKYFIADEPSGYSKDGTTYNTVVWKDKTFDLEEIRENYPTAEYVRFCSYGSPLKLIRSNASLSNKEVVSTLSSEDASIKKDMQHVFDGQIVNMTDYDNPMIELSIGY